MWRNRVAYVDTNLVGSGKVTRAAILGLAGGVWASSAGYSVRLVSRLIKVAARSCHINVALSIWNPRIYFRNSPDGRKFHAITSTRTGDLDGYRRCGGYQLSTEEQQKAVSLFANPSQAQEHGIRLGGQKFFALSANERSVYGKKAVCVLPHFPALYFKHFPLPIYMLLPPTAPSLLSRVMDCC